MIDFVIYPDKSVKFADAYEGLQELNRRIIFRRN